MEKQIRITIRLSSSTYAKLLRLAANYEGNVSMTIRRLIEKEKNEQLHPDLHLPRPTGGVRRREVSRLRWMQPLPEGHGQHRRFRAVRMR